jgi:hypothetical protein
MDEALTQLATAGAQTMVRLMATDLWHGMRSTIARIFGGPSRRDDSDLVGELEASRSKVVDAEAPLRTAIEEREKDLWEARLRVCLVEDPTISLLIKELLEAASAAGLPGPSNFGRISLHASAHDDSRIYQQGYGTQHNG